MWMMTSTGFFSVVATGRPGEVMIRARRLKDLVDLLARFGTAKQKRSILRTPKNDYLYRVIVQAKTWASWAGQLALDPLEYPNFKSEVGRSNDRRVKTYAKVWSACLEIEGEELHG